MIYIIAGEASGDLLGAHLMRSLKAKSKRPISFYGIGGEKMEAEGLKSLFPYYELSMLGFIEILPYAFNLMARIQMTVDDILAKHPDIVVTIDVPGFCYRVVKKLRAEKAKMKFVHYVAPSVWAYKPQRAERCAKVFDHLLALLPFEPPYFEKVGLKCTWVGHPVVAETPIGDGAAFREKYEIPADVPLLTLLPGSRKGEIDRHMPVFAKAITFLSEQIPDLAIAVAVPKNVMAFIAPYFQNCPFRAVVTASEEDKKNAIAASTLSIAKSGTVTIEVARAGVPMVVAYRVNPISAWVFRRISLTKYATIANILADKEIIPELLQELCVPILVASATSHLLSYPEHRKRQVEEATAALQKLVPSGGRKPSDIAAETILKLLPKN